MKEVLYVKYANERDERFSIKTEIIENDGERYVVKSPMTNAAALHVAHIHDAYKKLNLVYQRAGYEMNRIQKQEQGLCFEYIYGDTLENKWDKLLAEGNIMSVEKEILEFAEDIRGMFGVEKFCVTDRFRQIFGDVLIPQGLLCAKISNIDMLAGNIILAPSRKVVIDYEWVFDFPVPVDFIIYRMIHYYISTGDGKEELGQRMLYKKCRIDEALVKIFAAMEKKFQEYIVGDRVLLRELYQMISPGTFHVAPWIERETVRKKDSRLQVFFSFGKGYLEKESTYYEMGDGHIQLALILPKGVTNIRIDPGAICTLCEITMLRFDNSDMHIVAYNTTGFPVTENVILFTESDPQITLDSIPEKAEKLLLELRIITLEEPMLKLWRKNILTLREEEHRLKSENTGLELQLEEMEESQKQWQAVAEEVMEKNDRLQQKINSMEATKAWKLYVRYCKMRGRDTEYKIYSNIDWDKIEQGDDYIVSGWVAMSSGEKVELVIRIDGEPYEKFEIKRQDRADVKKKLRFLKNNTEQIGFAIIIKGCSDLSEEFNEIDIVAKTVGTEEVIFTKSLKELKKKLEEDKFNYHIDVLAKHSEDVVIQGWALGQNGKYDICVLDEAGNSIEADVRRLKRQDVLKAYGIELEYNCGFEIHFPRKGIMGKNFAVRFSGDEMKIDYMVDLKKFDRENTGRGRVMSILALSNFRNNCRFIRENGFAHFIRLLKRESEGSRNEYDVWRSDHALKKRQIRKQKKTVFSYAPCISISIPLYNTPLQYLKELLDSIENQTYSNWELCLADGSADDKIGEYIAERYRDKRIKYKRLQKNEGIAGNTNEALEMATGEFIMLADHDDVLAVNALYEMVAVLNEDAGIDIIYTDEDLMDATGTEFSSPRFKPDFNFDFLRSINYICHIFMVRKTIIDRVGIFRSGYDGAQDYDLILRCCEATKRIYHIPMILYHWRAHEDSTAGNPESKMYAVDAGKKALEEHYKRMNIDAKVEYTGIFILFKTIMKVAGAPKVSVLIPNKDHIDDLEKCIASIKKKTTYHNYEIIVIENNSEDEKTFEYYTALEDKYDNLKLVYWTEEFNYSKINNYGAKFAEGEYLIFLNNDTEVISETWMEEMLGYCQREDVGAVGAKLYYADDTVQHAGIVVGVGGFAGHVLTGSHREDTGFFGRLKAIQDISAVTAACIMVKRSVFWEVGGFDEKFVVALNDVDLCMKIRQEGQLIVFNPWVELYHYESKSRGYEDTPEKLQRFKKEIKRFRDKWNAELEQGDPYYNRNLTLDRGDCSIRRKDERFEIIEDL